MEEERVGCLKEAFKGFLNCLGLENGEGKGTSGNGEIVNNPAATDPLVEVLSSHIDNPTITTRSIDNNYNLVTIDEIMNTSGGTTAEAHYVELHDGGTDMSLLATRLITSGGGGKTN